MSDHPERSKQTASAFNDLKVNRGEPEVVRRYVGEFHVQHDPAVADRRRLHRVLRV